jgi:hypothetical protein
MWKDVTGSSLRVKLLVDQTPFYTVLLQTDMLLWALLRAPSDSYLHILDAAVPSSLSPRRPSHIKHAASHRLKNLQCAQRQAALSLQLKFFGFISSWWFRTGETIYFIPKSIGFEPCRLCCRNHNFHQITSRNN